MTEVKPGQPAPDGMTMNLIRGATSMLEMLAKKDLTHPEVAEAIKELRESPEFQVVFPAA